MGSPDVNTRRLVVNANASAKHNEGVKASNEGKFDAAYAAFDSAGTEINLIHPSIDSRVQHARIDRDRGFTLVREAVVTDIPTLLDNASGLLHSSETVLKYVDEYYNLHFADPGNEAEKLKEVYSERSATRSMLGRLATAQMVLTGESVQTEAYQEAHQLSLEGSNGYYRVGNAVNAARHERLASRPKETIKWLGRAAFGLAWTAVKDHGNLRQAVLTTGDRVLGLLSKKAAKASVLKRP